MLFKDINVEKKDEKTLFEKVQINERFLKNVF